MDWALVAAGAFLGALLVGSAGFAFAIVATAVAVCLPALAAGLTLGERVFDWISEAHFQRLVLALILASGLALLI